MNKKTVYGKKVIKMMVTKAVIINGSYKENGMTSALVKSFKIGLKKAKPSIEIEQINLSQTPVHFCKGCETCSKTGKEIGFCCITDDVKLILPHMLSCDILVYATPIYEFGPTALMKRFMERNIPILKPGSVIPIGRNPIRKEKIGVLLLSSGASYPINVVFGVTKYPTRRLKLLCKLWSCDKIYTLPAGGMEKNEVIKQKWLDKAERLGIIVGEKNKKTHY